MHLPPISSQPKHISADTTCQAGPCPKITKRLPVDDTLSDEQQSLHPIKTRKITTLEKPAGYFTVGEKYKISLMEDYLHGNTQYFSDDDWLYLIIKMGKRIINRKKQEAFQKESSRTKKECFLIKMTKLQILRYKIEDVVHHSHLKEKENKTPIKKKRIRHP